jgi:hypothetical protein
MRFFWKGVKTEKGSSWSWLWGTSWRGLSREGSKLEDDGVVVPLREGAAGEMVRDGRGGCCFSETDVVLRSGVEEREDDSGVVLWLVDGRDLRTEVPREGFVAVMLRVSRGLPAHTLCRRLSELDERNIAFQEARSRLRGTKNQPRVGRSFCKGNSCYYYSRGWPFRPTSPQGSGNDCWLRQSGRRRWHPIQ